MAGSCAKGAAWWPAVMVAEVFAEHAHHLFD
jgi:hypothetical protein